MSTDPRKLYRFVTIEGAKHILKDGKIRYTSPILLNDPFDGQLKPPCPFSEGELYEYMAKKMSEYIYEKKSVPKSEKRIFKSMLEKLKEHKSREESQADAVRYTTASTHLADAFTGWDPTSIMRKKWLIWQRKFRLISFSENNNNITMWSHYADHHKGVCLEFTDDGEDGLVRQAHEVHYVTKLPDFASLEEWGDYLLGLSRFVLCDRIEKYLLHKSMYWKNEKEWRILFHQLKADDLYCYRDFVPTELTGIYLGARISEINKHTIVSLCYRKYEKAKIFLAKTSNQDFALEFSELQENVIS